jgi:hypothetical protein
VLNFFPVRKALSFEHQVRCAEGARLPSVIAIKQTNKQKRIAKRSGEMSVAWESDDELDIELVSDSGEEETEGEHSPGAPAAAGLRWQPARGGLAGRWQPARVPRHGRCESCNITQPFFGMPAENRMRWCGPCGKPHGAVNLPTLRRRQKEAEAGLRQKEPTAAERGGGWVAACRAAEAAAKRAVPENVAAPVAAVKIEYRAVLAVKAEVRVHNARREEQLHFATTEGDVVVKKEMTEEEMEEMLAKKKVVVKQEMQEEAAYMAAAETARKREEYVLGSRTSPGELRKEAEKRGLQPERVPFVRSQSRKNRRKADPGRWCVPNAGAK